MAKKIVCDICGRDCTFSGFYKLQYICSLRTSKEDICVRCMREIKEIIKESKKTEEK